MADDSIPSGFALGDDGIVRKIVSRAAARATDLPRYFTGKPCKSGHISERYPLGSCVACVRAHNLVSRCDPTNAAMRRLKAQERTARRRTDPATRPQVLEQKRASARRHAKKWRQAMLQKLSGMQKAAACETCGSDRHICFDHCHETGIPRGWICNTCNTILGFAKDNPILLRALAQYLEKDRSACRAMPTYLRPELKRARRA
jgi:hypothetical protein